jgi:hypothetical protein
LAKFVTLFIKVIIIISLNSSKNQLKLLIIFTGTKIVKVIKIIPSSLLENNQIMTRISNNREQAKLLLKNTVSFENPNGKFK